MSCLCRRIFPNIWSLNHRCVWIKMSTIVSFDLSDSAAATCCRRMFSEIVPAPGSPPDLIAESGQSCAAWHHGSDWAYGPHLNSSCNEATLLRAMNKTPGPPLPWITSHCYYQVNQSINKHHEYPRHGLNTRHNSFAQFMNFFPGFPNYYFLHRRRDTYHMISEWVTCLSIRTSPGITLFSDRTCQHTSAIPWVLVTPMLLRQLLSVSLLWACWK